MVKVVIIDDEPHGIQSLETLIREYCPSLEISGTANSIEEGNKLLEEVQPGILFLDIEMPNGSGFELLKNIGPGRSFEVIFTTAYQHYAIQAIRENALDYLLKPIDAEELVKAVDKACRQIQSSPGDPESRLKNLLAHLEKIKLRRLAIPHADEILYVDFDHIIRLEAASNYTEIFLAGGKKHRVSRTLKDYEEQLADADFFRVHKAHLINISHVDRFVRQDGGYILMKDGTSIPVSRPRRDELLRALSS